MSKAVTLYVPAYNAAQFLDKVIPSVMAQTYPIEEVLIIDDGSTDGSVEEARRLSAEARYPTRIIEHGTNRGLGAARNTAVRNCRTEYVASIDADVTPSPDWLEVIMKNFSDRGIGGVGGCLEEQYNLSWGDHWRNTHMRQCWGDKKIDDVVFLFGSNTCFKTEYLLNAGLYDERARTNGEDVYISEQLHQAELQLLYTPEAICYHLRRDSVGSILRTAWRWRSLANWEEHTVKLTMKANVFNFINCGKLFLRKDCFEQFSPLNIGIDLVYPWYASYLDWRAFISHRYHARAGV